MAKEKKSKKPFYKRIWVWVLAVIIIGAVATGGDEEDTASDNGGNDAEATEANAEASSTDEGGEEESSEENTETKTAKIGEPSTVDDVTFTVTDVRETSEIDSGNEFIENATTSGKFVLVNVTVKNEKKDALTIDSSYFKLNAGGSEYDPTTSGEVTMALSSEDDFFLTQVNPGLEKSGTIAFEVGKDVEVSEAILKASPGFWGTVSTEIQLSE
ncbi:protein of unknown function [Halobacillus dabanensis]|uniref:DUF4352 domain-containing protein n=1 Tax=Halobacillus dabanensis TaxID=240302 RepID=A0A1I3RCR9_HALDA|nr:DUF4352 domain-containing protein [Halobacillus dabanensis]SFJ43830.1 protein of unknown function [Halobacillus dabanensis]